MNGKRDKGPADNPWVRKEPESGADEDAAPEPELPPSPWSLEVPPRSPWTDAGTPAPGGTGVPADPATNGPGTGDPAWGDPGTGGPGAGGSGAGGSGAGGSGAGGSGWGDSGVGGSGTGGPGPGGSGPGGTAAPGGGPARETSSPWGDKVGPPSLRRPEPVKKRPAIPPLLIPIAAGIGVVALVAVALILLTGDDSAKPTPGPSSPASVTTPPATTYTPPPNAIPVAFGVSVVPVDGWSVLATETEGKQLVTYAPNREPRAFFWVRQRENVAAREYVLRIVEGETKNEIAELGNPRNLACPRDVLVECVAISYTSTAKGVKVKGYVEAYKRKDGLVTALDFRTRVDFAQKAEPDAETMKKSVIDSL